MIYRAIVADSRDPADRGRLKVMIPALSGSAVSDWIWPVVSAGYVRVPSAGDQVWVTFENGDRDVPVWLGASQSAGEYQLLRRIEELESLLQVVFDTSTGTTSAVSTDGGSAVTPVYERFYVFTATSGQTVFSGTDDNGASLTFTSALVYLNGVLLTPGSDYTTASNSVTLTSGAAASDVLTVVPRA